MTTCLNSIKHMAGELSGALTKLSEVIAELNTDQQTIDSLNSQLATAIAAKNADDAIIAAEVVLDRKEAVLDYLRGKGRAIREGVIVISANEQETFNVPLSDIDQTDELQLVMGEFTRSGFVYSVITQ